jgi:methyl-accepting chemotaxis protein
VAEEVRNLAMKSMASLRDIESGINENVQFVQNIAKASKEQSTDINLINNSVSQVSLIVQQNSSTAETSAAASEELSGQAAILQELLTRFNTGGNVL